MAHVVVENRSKRYKESAKKAVEDALDVDKAIDVLKSFAPTKFDQSVELIFSLGIDAKHADQMIRGSLSLPHGVGKSKRVVAFCPEHLAPLALAAGAIRAGGQELVQAIEKENFTDFDVAVATPDMMPKIARLGKVLGPQGKMPSPKAGTVTTDVATAVKEYSAGKIEFRNDKGGNIHAAVGKLSFSDGDLAANIHAFIEKLRGMKPATAKGTYIKRVTVHSSMSPGIQIDTAHLNMVEEEE
jgi:large subunit ribosomal protein L1